MKQQPEPFNSVSFGEMVKWLKQPRRVPTLGRRSYIDASSPNINTIHIIGKNGSEKDIDNTYWDYVCAVINSTEPCRRHITTNYNQLRGYRFSPSIPALCRAYWEEIKDVKQ